MTGPALLVYQSTVDLGWEWRLVKPGFIDPVNVVDYGTSDGGTWTAGDAIRDGSAAHPDVRLVVKRPGEPLDAEHCRPAVLVPDQTEGTT